MARCTILSSTVVVILIAMSAYAYAKSDRPLLVIDMEDTVALPKKFRTTADPLPRSAHVNQYGLDQLHVIGSAQFSAESLQQAVQQLKLQKMMIVDLRQESHGYLNGNAVSWYGQHDAANENKTAAQIERDEAKRLQALREKTNTTVNLILDKTEDGIILKTKRVKFPVYRILSEADLAKLYNYDYHRMYVQDFHAPSPIEVDKFINVVKTRASDDWIYFHCRGGSGRTTELMVMIDMMKNAKCVSFEDILARQTALGGKDLTELPPEDSYKYAAAVLRLAFLKNFYRYCQTVDENFSLSWSAWVRDVPE
ncbi:MAG: hypothetical protein A3F14_00745 [Gammaproteobacteria bacterium RIFCSPHIGHO2_12_FULL_43_28]|nr:MAG: hypothetical protein A3F14_00745 [Gammaproteobacteria bacterium RIFCSPHIGHO2_12_FULL_43_28]